MVTVEQILERKGSDVVSVVLSWSVGRTVQKMIEANVGSVLVEAEGRVLGIFTERDLLRRVVGAGRDPRTTRIEEVMSRPVRSCAPADEVGACFDMLRGNSFRHLMVVDGVEPVGVISLRDVAWVLRATP
jgi:CBS domain-containing protein